MSSTYVTHTPHAGPTDLLFTCVHNLPLFDLEGAAIAKKKMMKKFGWYKHSEDGGGESASPPATCCGVFNILSNKNFIGVSIRVRLRRRHSLPGRRQRLLCLAHVRLQRFSIALIYHSHPGITAVESGFVAHIFLFLQGKDDGQQLLVRFPTCLCIYVYRFYVTPCEHAVSAPLQRPAVPAEPHNEEELPRGRQDH